MTAAQNRRYSLKERNASSANLGCTQEEWRTVGKIPRTLKAPQWYKNKKAKKAKRAAKRQQKSMIAEARWSLKQ